MRDLRMSSHVDFAPNSTATVNYFLCQIVNRFCIVLILFSNVLEHWTHRFFIYNMTRLAVTFLHKTFSIEKLGIFVSGEVSLCDLRFIKTFLQVVYVYRNLIGRNTLLEGSILLVTDFHFV